MRFGRCSQRYLASVCLTYNLVSRVVVLARQEAVGLRVLLVELPVALVVPLALVAVVAATVVVVVVAVEEEEAAVVVAVDVEEGAER